MNRPNILTFLLALLLALSSAASFASSTGFESCPRDASCISDHPDFGWLENDKDSNDLDSLGYGYQHPEFSLRNIHLLLRQFSLVDTPPNSYSQIRAPPRSL